MIEKISIKNFKSHADTTIELGRVTALVGPNGCGKSALLKAIYSLCSLAHKRPAEILTDEMAPDFLVRSNGKEFSVTASSHSNRPLWQLAINLSTSADYTGRIRDWDLQVEGNLEGMPVGVGKSRLDQLDALSKYLPADLIKQLGPVELFKALPSKLSQPSLLEVVPPALNADGSGLSSVVANLILSEDAKHKLIESELHRIVPTVLKVRARQTQIPEIEQVYSVTDRGIPRSQTVNRWKPGYELIFETSSASNVPAHAMSEGTMLALGILTLIHAPYSPALFLIDDIEYGLHPIAQRKMMEVLKKLAESQQRQVLITSHSPYVIDELEAKHVWVMATDSDGISHCQQLSKAPNAEFGLKVLTTGEFLDAEGEEWVLNSPVQEEPAHV